MIVKKRGRPFGKPNMPQGIYRIKTPQQVGQMIRKGRRDWGMTQAYVAEHCDCTASFVSQLERGISRATPDVIKKIFKLLNIEE